LIYGHRIGVQHAALFQPPDAKSWRERFFIPASGFGWPTARTSH
jgi:hypothetical protein